ncbi:AraC family transcriptional regulator [Chitinivorax sp. PXF-14]|uniref:AraC family transcriptional regulator n=1 Tax=Chitinivorax sp. PXF-14 TaxID=3230488 RepID=UPI0034663D55
MERKRGKLQWDFPRNVTSMRLMTQLGADYGLPASICLAGTDVLEKELADPAVVVSGAQELRLIHNLVEHLGHIPGLGIEAGKRYHFTTFGALGLAIVCSPNMLSALDISMRYFHLTFALTHFRVEETGGEIHVLLDDSGLPEAVRAFVVERDSAALINVQRDLYSSRPVLTGLQLAYPAPADVGAHEAFYHIRPVFGCASNLAILDVATLMAPLPQANELALRVAEEQCRALLDRYQSRSGFAATVRAHLARHVAQMPDMDSVAATLCMTSRTLRRRLLEDDTSFFKLREEVRLALSEEFLSSSSLSIEQIADRLGYAEPTSFINAFKRWTGKTPLSFRKQAQARVTLPRG